jgi:hypothetical protein
VLASARARVLVMGLKEGKGEGGVDVEGQPWYLMPGRGCAPSFSRAAGVGRIRPDKLSADIVVP